MATHIPHEHHHHHHHHDEVRERPKSTLMIAAVLSSIALVLFLLYGIPTIIDILRSGG